MSDRIKVAVCSAKGIRIDTHLGHAKYVLIYEITDGYPVLSESRRVPEDGHGNERWEKYTECIKDCKAIFAEAAGASPKTFFKNKNIEIIVTSGLISENLESFIKGETPINAVTGNGCGAATCTNGSTSGCSCNCQ